MFGPGVDEAIEKYVFPSRELMAVLQLFRASQRIVFRYEIIEGEKVFERTVNGKKWQMYNDTVVGYGRNGKEVARVSVEEPKFVRPDVHSNLI
jgi:nitrate reductase beta subunit